MRAAVHSGHFHADEVFAVAVLRMIHPDLEIVRTRVPETYNLMDFRLDVGQKYDPKTGDFDHHQTEGAGVRENGIPYATVGLVWKHFGDKLVDNGAAFRYVDEKLIQPIDAGDNGMTTYEVTHSEPFKISDIIELYNPDWQSEEDSNEQFEKAVEFAVDIINRVIERANGIGKADAYVEKAVEDCDGDIIILDRNDTSVFTGKIRSLVFPDCFFSPFKNVSIFTLPGLISVSMKGPMGAKVSKPFALMNWISFL